jgi:hypothetical protein
MAGFDDPNRKAVSNPMVIPTAEGCACQPNHARFDCLSRCLSCDSLASFLSGLRCDGFLLIYLALACSGSMRLGFCLQVGTLRVLEADHVAPDTPLQSLLPFACITDHHEIVAWQRSSLRPL